MKFYNRANELAELGKLYQQASESARMTVITGRRRVGKTMLALEFVKSHRSLYLFVSKKSEALLCAEFLEEIKKTFDVPVYGEIRHFRDVFALLIDVAKRERFTLIMDEFQEFYAINPAVYSEIQHLWDRNKSACRMNLICIGSVYSLMHRIFEESKEPLFGRADRILLLKPFSIRNVQAVLQDYRHDDLKTLFDCFALTGGLPKYLEILASNGALPYNEMLDFMLSEHSPFLNEGRNLLIEEFGKEYGTYFSILELIANGKTARTEIESVLEIHAGTYLARLEQDYGLISRRKPINTRPNARLVKYIINDNFLNFWFRFIFRNRSAVEAGNYAYIREVIDRDFATWSGLMLERFFHELFAESGDYNVIGSYWEKGNQNEIDLVAVNDLKKILTIAEIKLNKARINPEALKKKAEKLLVSYQGYEVRWLSLGLEDAGQYLSPLAAP
ncbi:MAG: ATPase [Geobacteraceae bacterium GWC2_58_44]|nr:MAG: ATPase [Geobacteraceae bacterium GWC2_58_44]HBG06594.1 ATPase [Geobacter sp.]